MKKFFLLTACLIACLALNAQDTKVAIASATATSEQGGEDASMAIDGNLSTFWHSQWGSGAVFNSVESVEFTITLKEVSLVDYVRYIPRQNHSNGHWGEVEVSYSSSLSGGSFTSVGTFNLGKMGLASDLSLNGEKRCGQIKLTIRSGNNNHATAAEIEAYKINNDKGEVFAEYFDAPLYTTPKSGIDINNIEDADVKALVASLQNGANADDYKKFRVGEYEPYMTLASVQKRLGTVSQYSRYENPTGIYFSKDDTYWVAVSGIENSPVYLTVKNWVENEKCCSYPLRNGLNCIESATEGNVFVSYYTDDPEAENVEVHFINAPVLGYWDKETMTNDDWKALLDGKSKDDNTILMVQSEHVQLAYPISAWLAYCPEKVSELMELYEKVQWAERDILGLNLFKKEVKNRQLYYATTYGFMAATGEGGYCNVNSLKAIMTPDVDMFDSWGVGHEWGHNNQIVGFHWSGCGEATNNIYASWAQLHFKENPSYLRLEDEEMTGGKFLIRGGRMQAYFEEALLNKVCWQLQEGQDNYKATPEEVTVMGQDADGNNTVNVTTTKRNYDHFVKLVPFWQLNLWGTMAKKSENIIPKVIESIRTTDNYTTTYNTNGKQQINWMKLACDKSGLNLLPFFEKAGMLRPINAYIEDYSAGWNIITEAMINQLKDYIKEAGYETPEEEINYINGHNYMVYRDELALEIPSTLGDGCTVSGEFVKVEHEKVKNAVAFETFNSKDELIRITMYGLGSDDSHSYTMVLFPADAAYIMAVGYNGERKAIYHGAPIEITMDENSPIYYTIYNTRSSQPGGLIYYAGDEVGLKDSPATLPIEDKYQFYFTGSHDAMYIHNRATGKKLASVESWTGEGVEWAIGFSPMGNGWAIGPKGGLDGNACINEKNFETEETVSDFTTWSANDAGSVFILEKVENLVFPESDKFYVIECPLFYNKQGVRKGLYVDGEGNLGWNTIDVMHKNYYWKLVENNGVVSLQNVGTGTYLNGDAMSETATNTTINYLGSNNYNIVANSVTVHANGHGGGSNASGSIVSYGGVIGTASAWTFVEKQNPDEAQKVTVKYIFKYNGTEVATQDVQTLMGEEYPNFTLPYGVVATTKKPEGVVETDGTTVNVEIAYSLSFVPANDFNSIQNWYYAQMHAYPGYGFYIFANDGKLVWNGSADANAHKVTATGDNLKDYLWGFVGNAWDGFKMVNKAGKAVCSTGDGDVTVGDLENATAFIVTNSQAKGEWFCLKNKDTDKYLNLDYYNATIQHWNANDNGSSVFLTEYGKTYDIAVLSTGYASYYSQYRLEIPETVEAYVVSEIDDECAILEQVTGILPENTGVILMGKGIHSFKTSAAAPASIENNELKGTAVDTEVSGDAYILANGESGIGLYKVELSNGKFTNNANKAYLPIVVEDGAEAPVLRLTTRGDDATSIDELSTVNGQQTTVIYDLTGRRVEKMEKGIYIVNGRKVVIK